MRREMTRSVREQEEKHACDNTYLVLQEPLATENDIHCRNKQAAGGEVREEVVRREWDVAHRLQSIEKYGWLGQPR